MGAAGREKLPLVIAAHRAYLAKMCFSKRRRLAKALHTPHVVSMTEKDDKDTSKKSGPNKVAIGAAATIGSAAIAAALLYVGKRSKKTREDKALGPNQSTTAPSGEPPETD